MQLFNKYRKEFTLFENYLSNNIMPYTDDKKALIDKLMNDNFLDQLNVKLENIFDKKAKVKLNNVIVKPSNYITNVEYKINCDGKDISIHCTIGKNNAQ